jgi:hypothetical protein
MSWFDDYALKARVAPLILTTVPLLVYGYVIIDFFVGANTSILGTTGAAAITMTVLVFGEQIVRKTGSALEKKLFESWGGPPTTHFLRFSDTTYSTTQKTRILKCLAKLAGERPPTEALERKSQSEFDARIASLIAHAREFTRNADEYPRVRAELKNYGFRRNLLALKPIGLFLSLIVAITACARIWILPIGQVSEWTLISVFIGAFWSLFWILIVNEQWVKEGGNHYARALLDAVATYKID